MDLIVRNARLRQRPDLVDIGIADGRIRRIERRLDDAAAREIDAGGHLTTPSFVEPHIHLDKALTADRASENRTNLFEEALAIMREVKRSYTVEDVAARATEAVHALVGHGVTFVRTYADVDSIVGLTALDGVLAARERCRRFARLEVIAFPQESFPHQPIRLNPSRASPRDVIVNVLSLRIFSARSHIAICIRSSTERSRSGRPSRGNSRFSPVSRRTAVTTCFARSRGPSSTRRGTPRASHS